MFMGIRKKKKYYKISRLYTNMVIVLQDNKTITFGIVLSTG